MYIIKLVLYGSGSCSFGKSSFPFASGDSVGRVSGGGSEVFVPTRINSTGNMVKFSFLFCDGEMVK